MIAIICGRVKNERPRIPLFTILYFLLTTPAHVGYIRDLTPTEFAHFGIQVLRDLISADTTKHFQSWCGTFLILIRR